MQITFSRSRVNRDLWNLYGPAAALVPETIVSVAKRDGSAVRKGVGGGPGTLPGGPGGGRGGRDPPDPDGRPGREGREEEGEGPVALGLRGDGGRIRPARCPVSVADHVEVFEVDAAT